MPREIPRPKRRRNPQKTRAAILEAAKTILAQDGQEGLSVSAVAKLAGINRGTAYQYFEQREDLVRATLDWVSSQLLKAVFPTAAEEARRTPAATRGQRLTNVISSMAEFNLQLADFAIDNPEIGRIWLFDLLSRDNPREDVFFQRFELSLQELIEGDAAEPDIDVEVISVLMLSGFFLWPVWVGAHARGKRARTQMARRFASEILRLNMHGVIHADSHALLQSYLRDKFPRN
ncbi:TetR/AcrR family transcriptional regulator [Haliea sp. E17]|uniref:TetR/AcrR family transcriptional regulator n=1 Tax=Haliea sp. E17 TaxID=3401576 RepID=UPI003AAEEE52